jgi:hypothetical protein
MHKLIQSATVWLVFVATMGPAAANTWRAPNAWGQVNQSGSVVLGDYAVSSSRWVGASERYEIEFDDGPYGSDDVTVVVTTQACPAGASPSLDHVGGKLLVYISGPTGARIQCAFSFITYFGERANVGPAPLDNHWAPAAPIAVGAVHIDAGIGPGTWGVDSAVWNADLKRFEIDITGYGFSIYDVAVVTPISAGCPAGVSPRHTSVSGKLIVQMIAPDRERVRCGFRFVAYAANLSYVMQKDGFEGDWLQSDLAIDAYGTVNQFNLAGLDHAHGVQSVSWNAAQGHYELTMDEYFNSASYAIVTIKGDAGSCPEGATARTNAYGGLLYVFIDGADGQGLECSFSFIAKIR